MLQFNEATHLNENQTVQGRINDIEEEDKKNIDHDEEEESTGSVSLADDEEEDEDEDLDDFSTCIDMIEDTKRNQKEIELRIRSMRAACGEEHQDF